MKTSNVRRVKGLTKEQEELRQRGLRLLARMIARRHLASLARERGLDPSACAAHLADSEVGPVTASSEGPRIVEEDEHAR
ncbi:MAG: hypothetical protein OXE02_10710 [Chloroflexi bacterium]|nr:hypothetical protein [Chloroflexota bacterium]